MPNQSDDFASVLAALDEAPPSGPHAKNQPSHPTGAEAVHLERVPIQIRVGLERTEALLIRSNSVQKTYLISSPRPFPIEQEVFLETDKSPQIRAKILDCRERPRGKVLTNSNRYFLIVAAIS